MNTQYAIIRIRDNKLMGYIVAKTSIKGQRYLVYTSGGKTCKMAITDEMQQLYRVDIQQIG